MKAVFVGVDVGASRTKLVVLNSEKKIIGYHVRKSGTDFTVTANKCLEAGLEMAKVGQQDILKTISTGYGRNNALFANGSVTEIGCHAKGCFHYFPVGITIVDIGGQDNKVIKVEENGKRAGFKMNRKCAAGTGAFLEEMSARLDVPLEEMDDLARQSENFVKLGSYCTVFSATEVLEHIRHGKKLPDIVKGVFFSVVKRIIEMDSFTENVVMTGGVVAYNPYLVTMMEEMIGKKILIPEHPQLSGAIGAALYAMEKESVKVS